jgi:hypothetical protein
MQFKAVKTAEGNMRTIPEYSVKRPAQSGGRPHRRKGIGASARDRTAHA